jgi:hypothetical protein
MVIQKAGIILQLGKLLQGPRLCRTEGIAMRNMTFAKITGLTIGTVTAWVLGVVTAPIWGSIIITLWLAQMWKEELES